MPMSCSVCGSPLPVGARFCPNCGAAVGPLLGTEERKMVTVLFADLVDSTGLARRLDPERTREVLSRFFDAATEELHALRGRPEKYIGDAVMAVFGLPQVREDDALRAIRAGLAIRARARRLGRELEPSVQLEVRIGVESGEAATGVGPAGQLLVTGTVVNTAARLQAAAEPGQLLSGPTAYELTADKVLFARKRRVRAKGFDAGIDAYPVETITTRSARRTIPFVGRVSEQGILGDSLGLASTTGKPVLVTILGEPGIGKSRIADELAAGLSASVRILRGQPRSYTDTATFSPAAAIVADLAIIDDDDSPEVTRAKLHALAEECCEPPDVDRIADRLALLFGAAEGLREESSFVTEVQAGFLELIDGLARDHPVLLIFDDAHTMRPAMLDLIERLGSPGRRGPRRALVLALARNELLEARPTWGAGGAGAVIIRLEPLTLDESTRLVRHASGGRVGEAEALSIAKRAGGNPFFIIETTGMLVTSGDGAPAKRTRLPPTVQAIIEARLDALPPRLRELARHASVFMYGFDLDELQLVDPAATEAELQQLEEAEVFVRQESTMGHWRIRHATLKEVAYANLPKRERQRLHRLIAQQLLADGHPSWAADHLELAAKAALDLDPDDRTAADEAAGALLFAGDRARRRMESRSAVDRYERALALGGPELFWGVREARALAGMGEALYWLGDYAEAKFALERAVNVAEAKDDAFSLSLALRFLGDIAINYEGDLDRAGRLHEQSLAASQRLGDPWAISRSLLFAGWVPWTRGRYAESEAVWQKALQTADPKDCWARIRALNALSINHGQIDDHDGALHLVEEASRLAEECGDEFSVAMTAVQRARVFDDLGRRDEALPWFDRGIAIFADVGARWEQADATAARGICNREMGRLDEAEADLQLAIKVAEELGDRQIPGWAWPALARVSEMRGDTVTAEERRRRSVEAESVGPH